MWLTWANGLTLIRALLALPCAWLAATEQWTWAALLLSLAIVSDLLDGPLARRLQQSSPLGGLADHATDAFFVTVLLAGLATGGYVNWLLPILVAASFAQYMVDSDALRGKSLRASWLGRANGIGYFVVAGLVVYANAIDSPWPSTASVQALAWLLVLTSLASMVDRLRPRRIAE
jgi:phosphatidylglycerophosphate synthase